ncbi:MAG: hypothetical protein H7238_16120 [Polaromonas sp.]|nr:hypothetical protein [Polaromonas sp.]
MKSSRLLSLCFAAVAFCFAAVAWAVEPVAMLVCTAVRAVKKFTLDGLKLVGSGSSDVYLSGVPLVQAKAFMLRVIKRERPVVSSAWRMCPST